jgi:hypothetical protein
MVVARGWSFLFCFLFQRLGKVSMETFAFPDHFGEGIEVHEKGVRVAGNTRLQRS